MARTPKERTIEHPPLFHCFKPAGISADKLVQVVLELDEYESIRLADYEGLEHEVAAMQMAISRSTFTRLVERARAKVAKLIVEGVNLTIDGGAVHFKRNRYYCKTCHHVFEAPLESKDILCPFCNSKDLENGAEGFGHGECCLDARKGSIKK